MKHNQFIAVICSLLVFILPSCKGGDSRTAEQAAVDIYLAEFNGEEEIVNPDYADEERKINKQHAANLHATFGEYTGKYELKQLDESPDGNVAKLSITFIHEKTNNPENLTIERDEDGVWKRSKKKWLIKDDGTWETYDPF